MKHKLLLAALLLATSMQIHASFAAGYVVGSAAGSSSSESNDVFISQKYDYAIACKVEYERLSESSFKYYCSHPPKRDSILFMNMVFNSEHWPSRIVYYMKANKDD